MKDKIITPRGTFEIEEVSSCKNWMELQNLTTRYNKEGYYYWFSHYEKNADGTIQHNIYIKQGQKNPQYKIIRTLLIL